MNAKDIQRERVAAVQKEQVQLVQIEKILTSLLGKVNESVNELKVEELQIKSSLVEQYTGEHHNDEQPTTSARAAAKYNESSTQIDNPLNIEPSSAPVDMEVIEDINKQLLAMESLLVPIKQKKYNEEEEEDDDDDEDYNEDDDDYVPSDEEY